MPGNKGSTLVKKQVLSFKQSKCLLCSASSSVPGSGEAKIKMTQFLSWTGMG